MTTTTWKTTMTRRPTTTKTRMTTSKTMGALTSNPKEAARCQTLSGLDSVVVAYSGGVDSAYLVLMASRTLGRRAVAVTADSGSYPERDRRLVVDIARDFGLQHETTRTGALERPDYRANPGNRCYFCKHE